MKQNKFSIILPVYNAEKYLVRTIESVLSQSYTCWELICVNDGSTDESLSICEKYQNMDSRIVVINKENRGVSDTRNIGISNTTGNYILFLDSDDYFSSAYLEDLAEILKNRKYDLVITNHFDILSNGIQKSTPIDEQDFTNSQEILKLINFSVRQSQWRFEGWYGNLRTVWGKCFDTHLIKEYQLKFEPSLKYGEDMVFLLEYLTKIDTAKLINKYYYYYDRTNLSSAMNSKSWAGTDQGLKYYEAVKKIAGPLVTEEALSDLWLETAESDWNTIFSSTLKCNQKVKIIKQLQQSPLYQYYSRDVRYLEAGKKKRIYLFFIKYKLSILFIFAWKTNKLKIISKE